MPEPEISHRCTSCGASVRGHALFCPQCGYPLTQTPKTANDTADGKAVGGPVTTEEAAPVSTEEPASEPPVEKSTSAQTETIPSGEPEVALKETGGATKDSVPELKPVAESGSASDGRRRPGASTALAANKARAKIKQATNAARDRIEDNVRPRVDKIRQASSVVLEEANYDPSVRFILVAGALFVLFVVLLIISKVI
jgi:predicted  nucleic acid-binding Zn-ribbon protein